MSQERTYKNPNATLAENTWLKRWPSFAASKIQPKCQSLAVPVKTELFTNNTASTYILTNVWQETPGGGRNMSWSLPYLNKRLPDCIIHGIDMSFESKVCSQRHGQQFVGSRKTSVWTSSLSNIPLPW
jgi:hypothetical protein